MLSQTQRLLTMDALSGERVFWQAHVFFLKSAKIGRVFLEEV